MRSQEDARIRTKASGSICGYILDNITSAFASEINHDIEESHRKGLPVARYDAVQKAAYLEFMDGTREHVNG